MLPAHRLARRGVGYVLQGRDIFPLLTVRENLETGCACLLMAERRVPEEVYIQQIGEVIRLLRGRGQMAIVPVERFLAFAYDLADRF